MSWLHPLTPVKFTALPRQRHSSDNLGRKGKLTREHKAFIDRHCAHMTFVAMGNAIGVNESCVRKYVYRVRK